jgi:hypothetical protein
MSMSLPRGWKVEQPGHDPNYQGTVGVLRRADEARLTLARRNLREIAEQNIEGQGLHLLDKTTGETMEVVTSFVDLVDPKATGVVAFTVRDGWLVPLRPVGWRDEADESHYAGEFGGRKAEPTDPMPMPVGNIY